MARQTKPSKAIILLKQFSTSEDYTNTVRDYSENKNPVRDVCVKTALPGPVNVVMKEELAKSGG